MKNDKTESEKKPNYVRQFYSDHPRIVIRGMMALGVISTVIAVQIAKPNSIQKDHIRFGEIVDDDLKKDGISMFYNDKLEDTVKEIKTNGCKVKSHDRLLFDYMKAVTEHAKIVEPD